MDLQNLLNKWNIKCDVKTILSMWNESHRHYHNLNHLNDLIDQINEYKDNSKCTQKEYEKLLIVALFHDVVYDPMSSQNEENSANFFSKCCESLSPDVSEIKQSILDTKTHSSQNKISSIFNSFDMKIVEREIGDLLEWENGIYNEFKSHGDENYKLGRMKFLESLLDKYPNNTDNLIKLIDYVKTNY